MSDPNNVPTVHPSRLKRPQRWRWLLGLLLVGVAVYFLARPAEERLLDPLGKPTLRLSDQRPGTITYRWSWHSNDELHEITNSTNVEQIVRIGAANVRTGVRRQFPEIVQAARRIGVKLLGYDPPGFSPDGAWYACYGESKGVHKLYAVRADGAQIVAWDLPAMGEPSVEEGWLPDGKSFVQAHEREALLYHLDRPGPPVRIALSPLPEDCSGAGITADGSVVIIGNEPSQSGSADICTLRLEGQKPSIRRTQVRLPDGCGRLYGRVNAQGTRIAWEFTFEEPVNGGWLSRLNRLLGKERHDRNGIWVSGLDGGHMRELGHIHYDGIDTFGLMGWLPGGNAIAFIRHDTIHVLPVE